MKVTPFGIVSFAVLPMLAQTQTCNPGQFLPGLFDPAVVLSGKGTLYASGTGTATFRVSGSIEVSAQDRTALVIFDAADVAYSLEGEGQTYWYQGHLIVDGMVGTASIEGEDLRVGMYGGPMEINAEGQGRVTLDGEGEYHTGDNEPALWAGDAQVVEYASGRQEPSTQPIEPNDAQTMRNYDDLIGRVRESLENPDVIVSGTGTLDAEGTGSASIIGSGIVDVAATGHSGILIFDADQALVELAGDGRTTWRAHDLIAEGYTGTAHVDGKSLRIVVTGGPMTLHAEGTGTVRLSGTGTYETNDKKLEEIVDEQVEVAF